MARPRLTAKQEDAIRKRLQAVVDDLFGGDWDALATRIGVERTTWYPWTGAGRKKGLPQAATLVKMAEQCRLSIDWLLTGRGPRQWHDGSETDALPDQFRHALVSEYAASEPGILSTYDTREGRRNGMPTPAEVERAVPPAPTVYRLCVEFIRPMVRQSLAPLREAALFAEGMQADPDARRISEKSRVAAIRKNRQRAEAAVASYHARAEEFAAVAQEHHEQDRRSYRFAEWMGLPAL